LLTNHHVIQGATMVTVTFSDNEEFEAKVVGSDPKTDLAVLKVVDPDAPLHAALLGDSDALRVGEEVIAIGNPFGLGHTVTSGIVSAKGRVIGAGPYDDFIQTDASINPGNSGGPLFNSSGEVVGINTAIIPNGQGIGFSVPINTAKPLVPQLIENGKVVRGYLGVTIQPVTKDLAEALNIDEAKGALVSDVVAGGPAASAGIKPGDVIVSFNGIEVEKSRELPAIVANTPVGENAKVVVDRKGQEKSLTVEVAELDSESSEIRPSTSDKTRWGLQLQNLTPQISRQLGLENDEGVLIAQVQPESPASQAGLREGDVLLEVDQSSVSSAEEAVTAIREHSSNSLLLTVKRGGTRLYVALTKSDN
jgi:serine protease Do